MHTLSNVSISGILEIVVDRNWGLTAQPLPAVEAHGQFANMLRYVRNIRYSIYDAEATAGVERITRPQT